MSLSQAPTLCQWSKLVVQGEVMLQQRAMLAARIADDRLKMPCDGR
jgi:hypothetical protein